IDPQRFHAAGRTPPSQIDPLRILFVGRLVPYKGADMVLEAVATSPFLRSRVEVTLVGDGPQRGELESFVRTAGLRDSVRFTGQLPQDQVVEHFRRSCIFAFPSVREFGGAVVMEAMACGLPCVVLDHGGPSEY